MKGQEEFEIGYDPASLKTLIETPSRFTNNETAGAGLSEKPGLKSLGTVIIVHSRRAYNTYLLDLTFTCSFNLSN
jgi:hypothetical protein